MSYLSYLSFWHQSWHFDYDWLIVLLSFLSFLSFFETLKPTFWKKIVLFVSLVSLVLLSFLSYLSYVSYLSYTSYISNLPYRHRSRHFGNDNHTRLTCLSYLIDLTYLTYLTDIEADILEMIVDYLYCGFIDVPTEKMDRLILAAKSLQIKVRYLSYKSYLS
jgi:hypothetical protein